MNINTGITPEGELNETGGNISDTSPSIPTLNNKEDTGERGVYPVHKQGALNHIGTFLVPENLQLF